MNSTNSTLVYIAGMGHSGSTLLDMYVGSRHKYFSVGELNRLSGNGIQFEYCSCGLTVGSCRIWGEVLSQWNSERQMSSVDYEIMRRRIERFAGLFNLLRNTLFPTEQFVRYCSDTKKLYNAISRVSGFSVIVESSKSPLRLLVLRRFIPEIEVIHLVRGVKGVLNSYRKSYKKDIAKGIELEISPRNSVKVVLSWIIVNALVAMICRSPIRRRYVSYRKFVRNPSLFLKGSMYNNDGNVERTILSDQLHLMAGNKLRLEKQLSIHEKEENLNFLTRPQSLFAGVVQTIFFFWK